MDNNSYINSKLYLARFEQILKEMADKMLSTKPTDNITKYFIECMIPHHQAAIYMCENLLEYTKFQPLINIARDIIKMQTRGIKQMREIYKTTMGYTNNQNEIYSYTQRYLEITKNMIYRMKNSPKDFNINMSFIGEMIPHHEGAIEMCNNLLQYKIDPRLRVVAKDIIREQSQGVRELRQIGNKLRKD